VTEKEFAARLITSMARLGYEPYRNPNHADGRHLFADGGRSAVYIRKGLVRSTPAAGLRAMMAALERR
jgi:hypothetical protein